MSDRAPLGLRSDGAVESSKRALSSVGRKSVVQVGPTPVKLAGRVDPGVKRESGIRFDAEMAKVKPNETVTVEVELPASMVVAAGSKLNELVYAGLRDTLNKRGVQWFGPRFLSRLRAKEQLAATRRRDRFTL